LAELRSENLLTDEEFDDLKGRLLARCRSELGEAEVVGLEESEAVPDAPHPDQSVRSHVSPEESAMAALDWSDPLRSLLGPAGAQNRSSVEYEVRWANGTAFVIGSTEDLQVWVAFAAGRDPQALVYIVNASDRRITFAPESIQATAVRSTNAGLSRLPVSTFSAADYERKVRNKQAWQAFLYGAAAGMANQPQPQQESVSGGYSSYRQLQPGSQLHGSFYGQITRWPTAADYTAARDRTAAQVNAMGEQLHASFDAMAATLMRTHTLEPNSYYGGIVHFERFRGERVILTIPLGGSVFVTEFTLP
jgi:hypothetical protein